MSVMSTAVRSFVVAVVAVFVAAAGAMPVAGGQDGASTIDYAPTDAEVTTVPPPQTLHHILHHPHSSWSLFTEDPDMAAVTASLAHDRAGDAYFESEILKVDPRFFATKNDYQLKRYLVFGPNPAGAGLAAAAGVGSAGTLGTLGAPMMPTGGLFSISVMSAEAASELSSQGLIVIEDRPLDLHEPAAVSPYDVDGADDTYAAGYAAAGTPIIGSGEHSAVPGLRALSGLDTDAEAYNATGAGVTVAIVDTGVDFSNPDMRHAVARDPDNNHPVMLDPDGRGIVLTNSTFFANIDQDGIIWNHTGPVPEGYDSVAYVTGEGVFLDISQKGRGTIIDVYNSLFPTAGKSPVFEGKLDNDVRIGESGRDYIRSESGTYRLGVIYQIGSPGPAAGPAGLQVVPVLAVDSFVAGTYDTIIPDMSSSWMDYSHKSGDKKPDFDFDFTDEEQIVLGSGNEFLIYDSDGDGMIDYTAGAVGARVLDVYSVTNASLSTHYDDTLRAVNGTLLPSIDPGGRFFGIMTDYNGHGTSSAATIASSGKMVYDIYNDTGEHSLRGVAPDAQILPVKALWMGDVVYGWLWSAGFENNENRWVFTGRPRADIISNSWGISSFPSVGVSPGSDILALVLNMLATPRSLHDDYPGVVVVSSSGNAGHGYGTMGTPGVASLGISVGASTSNVFVGYGPFKDQPRFGNSTGHHGHISDFSSRGPGPLGDPKPDLVGLGAHGFVPYVMMGASSDSSVRDPFSLFGGTSMSAPVVSGVAALVMEQMTGRLLDYDPFVVRNILMSTAADMHNDPFTQGSGLADAGMALDFVHGDGGVFVVHNDASYTNIRDLLLPAISAANLTDTGIGNFELPDKRVPMTSWFAGYLEPGERTTVTFTIENPGNSTLDVTITPQAMSLLERTQYEGSTVPRQQDPILDGTDVFVPNYIRLADVRTHEDLGGLFDDSSPFPDDVSLLVLNVSFDFADFMNATAKTYADDLGIASLYVYDWVDKNADDVVASDELSMVTRGGSWGTVQEIRVSNPAVLFDGVPTVGVYPVPTKYSYWAGATGANATSMNYTVSASYYDRGEWNALWPGQVEAQVPPDGIYKIDVTLVVPDDLPTGIYQGFLTFEGSSHTTNVPVSYVVREPVRGEEEFLIGSMDGSLESNAYVDLRDVMYGSGYTKGAFDMVDRYMAGDWRHYYFDVQSEDVDAASIEISWESEHTSMSVFVMNPVGEIIQTNVPPGVFDYFLGWPSADWLGTTQFSGGGGFYPVNGYDEAAEKSTLLNVPIDGTGTYTVLTHTTLFGGESTTEPITLAARFFESGSGADGELLAGVGNRDDASTIVDSSSLAAADLASIVVGTDTAGSGALVGGQTTPGKTGAAGTTMEKTWTDVQEPVLTVDNTAQDEPQSVSASGDAVVQPPTKSGAAGAEFSGDAAVEQVTTPAVSGTAAAVMPPVILADDTSPPYAIFGMVAAGAVLGAVILWHRRAAVRTSRALASYRGAPIK